MRSKSSEFLVMFVSFPLMTLHSMVSCIVCRGIAARCAALYSQRFGRASSETRDVEEKKLTKLALPPPDERGWRCRAETIMPRWVRAPRYAPKYRLGNCSKCLSRSEMQSRRVGFGTAARVLRTINMNYGKRSRTGPKGIVRGIARCIYESISARVWIQA